MQFLCQLTGILNCGVVLLIRGEDVRLGVQAEGIVQQPSAVHGVFLLAVIVRLIASAGELLSVSEIHAEAELLCFGGMDVEEGNRVTENRFCFAVLHCDQMQLTVKGAEFVLL